MKTCRFALSEHYSVGNACKIVHMVVTEYRKLNVACFFPCVKYTAVKFTAGRVFAEIAVNRLVFDVITSLSFSEALDAPRKLIRLCFMSEVVFLPYGNVHKPCGRNNSAVMIFNYLCGC